MKKSFYLAAALLAGMATNAAVAQDGGPWAGIVRVSDTTSQISVGIDISYELSFDADSVTIDILDSGDNVVATFAGTATSGPNTVSWDGTVDNAGGADVPTGTDYKVRVTVDNNAAAGWAEVVKYIGNNATGTDPLATYPYFFSPQGFITFTDQTSDFYGISLVRTSSTTTNAHSGSIIVTPDMAPQSDIATLFDSLSTALVNRTTPTASGSVWGAAIVPGTNNILYAGQATGDPTTGDYHLAVNTADALQVDATNVGIAGLPGNPRSVTIIPDGVDLFGYATSGAGVVQKFPLDATGAPTGAGFNIIDASLVGLYSLAVTTDSADNLYWVARAGGASSGETTIYRFPAATVAAIDLDTDPKLSAASADWTITFDASAPARFGVTPIFKGDSVFVPAGLANGNSADFALYLIGDVSTTPLTKNILPADVVFSIVGGNNMNALYGPGNFDPVGNFFVANRSPETVTYYTPGGVTSNATVAPDSQTFDIADAPLSSTNWDLYN